VTFHSLPESHRQVLIDGLPVFERYGLLLAGGYAFRAHEFLSRPSQDLDFATSSMDPLPELAEQVRTAFEELGYTTRIVEASGRSARLVLELPGFGTALELDILKEALGPRFISVQIDPRTHLKVISLEDAVGLKARAWHDRFVIRDIIDLHAVADLFSYVELESLARRHEPDLDLESLLDHLAGVSVFSDDDDFAEYHIHEPTISNLRRWVTCWYDDLASRLAQRQDPYTDEDDPRDW
jgi:hypothetical protein